MSAYTIAAYSAQALRDALVEASHGRNETVRQKPHAEYLDEYLREIGARAMVVERTYVDRDFLEDFAAYHVRCFEDYGRTCTRLHFFSVDLDEGTFDSFLTRREAPTTLQQAYLGFVVLKPLPSTVVGRTCLATYPARPPGRERFFPTVGPEQANLFGIDLAVRSLPFQEQDRDVAACASSALWSVLNGASGLFENPTPSPVEITKSAGLHVRAENRHFPAGGGLTSNQVADAIRSVGLEPHAIGAADPDVLRVAALAYLRAGIPCMLLGQMYTVTPAGAASHLGGHAIAVAGYGHPNATGPASLGSGCRLKALAVDRFYCHDDQVGPFAKLQFQPNGLVRAPQGAGAMSLLQPQVLVVPLYHKIRISVLDVFERLQELDQFIEVLRLKGLLPLAERVTWDIRLTPLNGLRRELAGSQLDEVSKRRLLTRNYPRFVWRMEASIGGGALFETLLDATDLLQGTHLVDVAPYDKPVCRAIAAAAPSLAPAFSWWPRAGRVLNWFANNPQHLR